MKKLIIGALVASLILFFWQFVSWSFLHTSQLSHSANQKEILECLEGKLEPGQYLLPTVPVGTSAEDRQTLIAPYLGGNWAQINYQSHLSMDMGMNLIRGFAIDFMAALLLCWLFGRLRDFDMKTSVLAAVAVGLIGYGTISYLNSIWFKTTSFPDLLDAIIPWTLVGVWLGWWLKR